MDRSDALRILAEGRPSRPIALAAALVVGLGWCVRGRLGAHRRGRLMRIGGTVALAAVAWLALAVPALAASPTPSSGVGGDPRSSGQGPGLVAIPASPSSRDRDRPRRLRAGPCCTSG
jgi:hypothetical protein